MITLKKHKNVILLCITFIPYCLWAQSHTTSFKKNVYTPIQKASLAIEKGDISYTETTHYPQGKTAVNHCRAGVLAFPYINTPTPVLGVRFNEDSLIYIIKLSKYTITDNTPTEIQGLNEIGIFYGEQPFLAFYAHNMTIAFPNDQYSVTRKKGNITVEYHITGNNDMAGHYIYTFDTKNGLLSYYSFQPSQENNSTHRYTRKEYRLIKYESTFPHELINEILNNKDRK